MKARWSGLLLALVVAHDAGAQSLDRSVIGNGGLVTSGAGYQVVGTVGQPLVGGTDVPGGPGHIVCSGWWCIERGTLVAVPDVEPAESGPTSFDPPRPHPTRGAVALAFTLARGAHVEVALHDVTGARVETLVSGPLEAGRHEVRWDGASRGRRCGPGIYFVSFTLDGRTIHRQKLVRLR
jgi:hypothetical protein